MGDSLHGVGVSPGVALGPAHVLIRPQGPGATGRPAQEERQAFEQALVRGVDQLARIAEKLRGEGRESEAGIMDAQALMLQDPSLLDPVRQRIDGGEPAGTALEQEAGRFKAMLEALDDPYMAARAADLGDVVSRVIRNLEPGDETPAPVQPSILVAHDLTPSETASLDRALVLGFATDAGSPTSHTAILARALDIPAVVGLGDVASRVTEGQQLILDGEHGIVVLEPRPEQRREYEERAHAETERRNRLAALREAPATTRDGHRVTLAANIGSPDDLPAARDAGAEGVGLFRTEFLFAGRDTMPSEDEQVDAYRTVLEAMGDELVVVRTLDIGGDKPLAYLPHREEANPFLGERGIRYTFSQPELFRTQLRALLRASQHGKLAIMFPMVGDVEQIRRARHVVDEVRQEVGGQAEIGIMVEIPAAALIAHALAADVSFFSAGTNDLIQYTLAVDRVNDRVSSLYEPLHPAVLRLLSATAEAAHARGRWAGVCGEMAGDPLAIPILVGLGFDELSMTPSRIPAVKERIRDLELAACRELARRSLDCTSAAEVARLVQG